MTRVAMRQMCLCLCLLAACRQKYLNLTFFPRGGCKKFITSRRHFSLSISLPSSSLLSYRVFQRQYAGHPTGEHNITYEAITTTTRYLQGVSTVLVRACTKVHFHSNKILYGQGQAIRKVFLVQRQLTLILVFHSANER